MQYLRLQELNKKPFSRDAAAEKIYWDQLKMLLFLCMCVKPQQNSQAILYWEASIHYACDLYAFCPYTVWRVGAACDHYGVKNGSLTHFSFEFFSLKKSYFSFRDFFLNVHSKMVKCMPQSGFKLGCKTVIQNPF